MGLLLGWWKLDHNTHQMVCNAVEHNPDIQQMRLLAIHKQIIELTKPFWDTYHKKIVKIPSGYPPGSPKSSRGYPPGANYALK